MRAEPEQPEGERTAAPAVSPEPIPSALWGLALYCLLTGGWLLLQNAQQPDDPIAAQLEERTIEVGIRVTESLHWLDPKGNPEPELTAQNLAEMAQQAYDMSEDEAVPETVQQQARILWLLYTTPEYASWTTTSLQAEAEDTEAPVTDEGLSAGKEAQPSIQTERVPVAPVELTESTEPTWDEDYLNESSEEGVGVLSALVSKMSAAQPIVENDLTGLGDTSMSPWLRRRLHAVVTSHGEPIATDSSHAHAEQSFMAKLVLVFAGMAIMGLLGLGLLIAAPFQWKRLPLGLGIAGPSPFVRGRWGGWTVLLAWMAFYFTLPLVFQLVGSVVEISGGMAILLVVITQVLQGLFALWAIGNFGMAEARQSVGEVLGTMRMGLDPFDGNAFRPLFWGLGGYAVAIPLVFVASLIQLLLPFDTSIASGPVFQWLLHPPDGLSHFLIIVAIVLIAPFFEEILFRGFLYRQLRAHLGVWSAILISAAVFSLVHMALGRAIPLFALGVILALIKERSGGLMPCMLLHAFWNGATVIQTVVLFGD